MASLAIPNLSQLADSNINVYESLYKQADPRGVGSIDATNAAAFLKKSGLKETVLHKIWELSDPSGKGTLDKQSFFLALKLIALAQNGKEINVVNLNLQVPAPIMNGTFTAPFASSTWAIGDQEKSKYDSVFDGLNPVNGVLSGDKVKPVFLNSKLPVETLSKVWDLSDIDRDGFLDKDEFAVAMHLVYKSLENEPVPALLPANLVPPSKRKPGLLSGVAVLPTNAGSLNQRPPTPSSSGTASPATMSPKLSIRNPPHHSKPAATWVVSAQDKANSDTIFKQLDTDGDLLVTGEEARSILIQSGLPQPTLAHIWSLCDMKNIGKLNAEQFALALYLIKQVQQGVEPPQQLTPDMIPPLSRPKPGADSTHLSLDPGSAAIAAAMIGDFSAIKELDMISKEIDQLSQESSTLQDDIKAKNEQMNKRNSEIQELRAELDKLTESIKQLEGQKQEAQKKLDLLDQEKSKLETELGQIKKNYQDKENQVNTLKSQITLQENTIKSQEEELDRARNELSVLREEESQLERRVEAGKSQLDSVVKKLTKTQDDINQSNSKIVQLKEIEQNLNESISQYTSAIEKLKKGDVTFDSQGAIEEFNTLVPAPEIDTVSLRATAGSSPVSNFSGFSMASALTDKNEEEDDKTLKMDMFASDLGRPSDPFHSSDPFKEDPFKTSKKASDPFGGDPFKDSDPFAGGAPAFNNGDPFGNSDPFQPSPDSLPNRTAAAVSSSDPFGSVDPFSGQSFADFDQKVGSGGDSFPSSDPFTAPPAATEPTPALPPKKSKQQTSTPSNTADLFSAFGTSPEGSTLTPVTSDPFQGSATTPDQAAAAGSFQASPTSSSDPFQAFAGSDPFASSQAAATQVKDAFAGGQDPFAGLPTNPPAVTATATANSDFFADFANFSTTKMSTAATSASEEEQMAWATQESQRLEKERQLRLQQQEDADLQKALALSRSENPSSET